MVWRKNNDKWVKTGGVKRGRRNSVGGKHRVGKKEVRKKRVKRRHQVGGKQGGEKNAR